MTRNKLLALFFIIGGILTGAATYLTTAPAAIPAVAFHNQLMAVVLATFFYTGGATILLLGLKRFTATFKRAYIMMCTGFILLGLGFLQIPIVTLIVENIRTTPWVTSGAISLPFLIGTLLIYFGVRTYARLFGVKAPWSSATLALGLTVVVGAIGVLLPHPPWDGQPEISFDGTVVVITLTIVLVQAAAVLAYQAKRHASPTYAKPLLLLAIGLGASSLSPLYELLAGFLIPNGIDRTANGIFMIPAIAGGLIFIRAALVFHSTTQTEGETNPQQPSVVTTPQQTTDTGKTALEAITYAASLASTMQAIDATLDQVRHLTASLTPGAPIPTEAQAQLIRLYLELEHYLITEEPVRRYGATELRQMVEADLIEEHLANSTFWEKVDLASTPAPAPVTPVAAPAPPTAIVTQ